MTKKTIRLAMIVVLAFTMTNVASADTTALYKFDEGAAGTYVTTVLNAVDSTLYSGTAESYYSGPMPAYSLDVPGYNLYSDTYCTNLLSDSANSVLFAPAAGDSQSGGRISITNLATAISAMDEGTIEFFFKSDTYQEYSNLIDFNAGQPFKIYVYRSGLTFQNYYKYGIAALYDRATMSASSGYWMHIAIVWSKANNMVSNYLDRVYQSCEILTNTTTTISRPLSVGGSLDCDKRYFLKGKMFGLRVSDRILAPEEMMKTTFFPAPDDKIVVSSDGLTSTHASVLQIKSGGRLKIRDGVAFTAGCVQYAGSEVPAGVYTGASGTAGAQVVSWIDGAGTLTVADSSSASAVAWISDSDGSWTTAANWLPSMIPSASRSACVDLPKSDSYTVTLSSPAEAPPSVHIAGNSSATATVDVATGGALNFNAGSVTIDKGGVLQISGGSVSATNSTFTVNEGGALRITDGHFAFTNTTGKFALKTGSTLELSGGELSLSGANYVMDSQFGSRIIASGDARFVTMQNKREQSRYYGDMVFSGNSRLRTHHAFFGPDKASCRSEITFKDSAGMEFYDNAQVGIGGPSCAGSVTVNLESSSKIIIPYGINTGAKEGATLNIRNGQYLRGNGNLNGVGYTQNYQYGVVNVYDGAFVQYSSAQYGDCLYGLCVGDRRSLTKTMRVEGILNIYPDGIVSNLTSTKTTKGAGVYLRVGTGENVKGTINQLGGTLYHDSNLQCMIGVFGGVGEWNVVSGGVARLLTDVYVGGARTNELLGFTTTGVLPGHSPWNGGPDFADKYDAFAPGKGVLSVENGTFSTSSNLLLSVVGEGTVSVGPGNGRIEANNVILSNTVCVVDAVETISNSTVRVRFGEGTVGTVAAAEKLVVSAGSRLVLDFTGYVKTKRTWFPILQYVEREGFFDDADVEIEGDVPSGGEIVKDATRNGVHGTWYHIQRGMCLYIK